MHHRAFLTPWCSGNTADFGSAILGSSPSGVAFFEGGGGGWKADVETIGEKVRVCQASRTLARTSSSSTPPKGMNHPTFTFGGTGRRQSFPVRLAESRRFSDHQLRELEKAVEENQPKFLEAWNEHFGN
jgi:hypothetical protein